MICLLFYPLANALCSLFAGIIHILVGNVGEEINEIGNCTINVSEEIIGHEIFPVHASPVDIKFGH